MNYECPAVKQGFFFEVMDDETMVLAGWVIGGGSGWVRG
jgi:hypothetical protein